MGKVQGVDNLDDFVKIVHDNDEVVVKYWAEWCGPCRSMAPHYEKLAEQNDSVFLSVDVDKAPWATSEYGVRGVPTVMLFRNGEYVKNINGKTVVQMSAELT